MQSNDAMQGKQQFFNLTNFSQNYDPKMLASLQTPHSQIPLTTFAQSPSLQPFPAMVKAGHLTTPNTLPLLNTPSPSTVPTFPPMSSLNLPEALSLSAALQNKVAQLTNFYTQLQFRQNSVQEQLSEATKQSFQGCNGHNHALHLSRSTNSLSTLASSCTTGTLAAMASPSLQSVVPVNASVPPMQLPISSSLEPPKKKRKGPPKGKVCKKEGCGKYAQGGTSFCVAHGGGRRCKFEGCSAGARARTSYCIKHGGGKRCQEIGCTKSAVGATLFCVRHGGGRRCLIRNCNKAAQGATLFCVKHGGGRRCQYPHCQKSAISKSNYCKSHGKKA